MQAGEGQREGDRRSKANFCVSPSSPIFYSYHQSQVAKRWSYVQCSSANTGETFILCSYLFLSCGFFWAHWITHFINLILAHLGITVILQKQVTNIYFLLVSLPKRRASCKMLIITVSQGERNLWADALRHWSLLPPFPFKFCLKNSTIEGATLI